MAGAALRGRLSFAGKEKADTLRRGESPLMPAFSTSRLRGRRSQSNCHFWLSSGLTKPFEIYSRPVWMQNSKVKIDRLSHLATGIGWRGNGTRKAGATADVPCRHLK